MKRKKTLSKPVTTNVLLVDESYSIHKKKGNGVIRRQVWANVKGEITRYSLAYINHRLFHGDNGRVLGFDNAHGYHHKHYMGDIESVDFKNFEDIERQFEQEFEVLHEKAKE